jgi:hypothetical protein
MSCHLATQEEELFKICSVRIKRLASLLIRVLKVGLRMLPLLWSDPFLPEFPPFMLDVLELVDSPVESPKCVCTQNKQELEAPAQN